MRIPAIRKMYEGIFDVCKEMGTGGGEPSRGGCGRASRRVRCPAAHHAAGGEPPLASRGMQNSQRVLLAKPRTAPMARRRDGDIAPYRHAAREVRAGRGTGGAHDEGAPAKPHERCARRGVREGAMGARGVGGCVARVRGQSLTGGQAGCRILGADLLLSGLSIEKKSRYIFCRAFAEAIADGGFVQPVFGVST